MIDPEKPLWSFFFLSLGIYSNDEAVAHYGEEQHNPNDKAEIDAKTGEMQAAFPMDQGMGKRWRIGC